MASRVHVEEVAAPTPQQAALAGFRAGWSAACLALADALAAAAPRDVVDAVRDVAGRPPVPTVVVHDNDPRRVPRG